MPTDADVVARLRTGVCIEDGCGKPLHTMQGVKMKWCRDHTEEELRKVLPGMLKDAIEEATGG